MKSASTKNPKAPDWVFLLEESVKDRARNPEGPGWAMFEEILASLKGRAGQAYLRRVLADAVRRGSVEKFVGSRVRELDGKLYRCVWYRRKDGGKIS